MLTFKGFLIIEESGKSGLEAKSKKSGVSLSTLKKVYARGIAAWNSGHRPGTTPQQWAMARVNSYITKGKGTYHGADKDLREDTDPVKTLQSSLKEPTSYDAIDQMMQTIAKESGISPKELHDSFVKKYGKTPDKYAKTVVEAAVPKDTESGLPKKYVAGVSASTAKARAAHFAKADKLSDSNPKAYEPAPGDATAKTKESEHTKKYRDMFGEDMDEELYEACWSGYKQVGVKKKGDRMVPNCIPEEDELDEAEYQGREVSLGKPTKGDVKKSKVYVKDPQTGNVKKVNFGDPNMTIKKDNPARRRSFRARHNCDDPGPKTKARYWSCKAW